MIDTLFIGSSTKDMLMQVSAPPASDRHINARSFCVTCGGVSATAAFAHKSLGGSTGVVTAVGDDEAGRFIRDDLEGQRLDYLKLLTFPGQSSSVSMIQVEEDGKRCITCFGGCIREMKFEQLDPEIFHAARIVHLGVLDQETALRICRYCRENTGAMISIDGGNLPRERMEELLPLADIFIPDNKTAADTLGLEPERACRWYVEHGCGIACVTAAERGTWAFDGRRSFHAEALSTRVVDTTGAGDNFHGAFLYCVNRGWELPRCLRFANVLASLSCRGMGGRTAVPTLEETLALCD